jgi:hypothetical protein
MIERSRGKKKASNIQIEETKRSALPVSPLHQITHRRLFYSALPPTPSRLPQLLKRLNMKTGTLVQRQLINADDSVLIIFRITTHLFFGRTNSPSSSS